MQSKRNSTTIKKNINVFRRIPRLHEYNQPFHVNKNFHVTFENKLVVSTYARALTDHPKADSYLLLFRNDDDKLSEIIGYSPEKTYYTSD